MTGTRPLYGVDRAVAHALAMVGRGVYQLGTGDLQSNNDDPRDCFGFAVCECFGIRRHRSGFNRGWRDQPTPEYPEGRTPSVVDDLNCNSAIEDADHAGELFERVTTPAPGILLAYPTIHLSGHAPFIGHIGIVVGVGRCSEWDPGRPRYDLLEMVQCHGPNGSKPGIVRTDGSVWLHHDALWPKPTHRTVMLRVLP